MRKRAHEIISHSAYLDDQLAENKGMLEELRMKLASTVEEKNKAENRAAAAESQLALLKSVGEKKKGEVAKP